MSFQYPNSAGLWRSAHHGWWNPKYEKIHLNLKILSTTKSRIKHDSNDVNLNL